MPAVAPAYSPFWYFQINGVPLVGGQLFTYAAGTSTKQATYTDSTGTTQNTNPILLNSRGETANISGASCGVWCIPGQAYKFVLALPTDSDPPANPIDTIDNITAPQQGLAANQVSYYGTDSGSVNAYVVTLSGSLPFALLTGELVRFTALNGNTGASTLNAGGTGAQPVVGQTGLALTGGEILSTGPTWVQWTGSAWQIVGTGAQPANVRTAAEIFASVMPVNYAWPTLYPNRYGAVGDGVTNDAVAVQAAFNVAGKAGGEVYFPPGYTFLCNADITVPTASTFGGPCASIRGQGWPNWSVIFGTGSTFGFVYLGGGATTGGVTTANYYYAGPVLNLGVKMTGTSNTAFYCNSVNQPQMNKVWIAGTGGQGRAVLFLNCLLPAFADCLVTGMGSTTQGSVEFDSCTSAAWRGSRVSGGNTTGGGLLIDRCVNFTGNCIAVESCGPPIKIGSKAEASVACTTVILDGLEIENPGNNPYIDIGQGLSGSALVIDVHIRGLYGSPSGTTTVPFAVRFRATTGIVIESPHFTLGAAPTSCFEMPDTTCTGVIIRAARNLQSLNVPWVRYNAVQVFSAGPQYDWWLGKTRNNFPICQVDGLKDFFNTSLTGATPDIRISTTMGGYYSAVSMANGGATTVTSLAGGELGMHIYILAADSNTTLTFGNSGGAFSTRSGANITMSAGKIYEFINDGASGGAGGSCWRQIGDN